MRWFLVQGRVVLGACAQQLETELGAAGGGFSDAALGRGAGGQRVDLARGGAEEEVALDVVLAHADAGCGEVDHGVQGLVLRSAGGAAGG